MEVIKVRRPPEPSRHLNKVTIQGVVTSQIKKKILQSGTSSIAFKIVSNETFMSGGKTIVHENEFVIEALGQVASKVERLVKRGGNYVFDGYLRSDKFSGSPGKKLKRIRVRIFHVEKY
jgi:single-stranded DNA-binding protein